VVDQDSELAGRGRDGLRLPDAVGESAIDGAEGDLRPAEAHGSHAEDRGGAVRRRLGARAQEPPPEILLLGTRGWAIAEPFTSWLTHAHQLRPPGESHPARG
jgi:hypothetical protein